MKITGGRKRIALDTALLVVAAIGLWYVLLRRTPMPEMEGIETIPLSIRQLWDPESPDLEEWQAFSRPSQLIQGPLGELILSDRRLGSVVRFTTEGEIIEIVGRRGGGPGEFQEPVDLAVDRTASVLWVVDRGNASISRFRLAETGSRFMDRVRITQIGLLREPGLVLDGESGFFIVNPVESRTDPARIIHVSREGETIGRFGPLWEPEGWGRGSELNLNSGYLIPAGSSTIAFLWSYQNRLERWSPEGELLAESSLDLPEAEAVRKYEEWFLSRDETGRDWLPMTCSLMLAYEEEEDVLYLVVGGVLRRGMLPFDVDVAISIYAFTTDTLLPLERYSLPVRRLDEAIDIAGLVVQRSDTRPRFYVLDKNTHTVLVLEPAPD